ncbi:MAG: DNA/RNA non-specific endonuclease [Bacteroidales bacterium]|nr:DNA/RNA non-specific endonuclease [Bacteroidales bacterium]
MRPIWHTTLQTMLMAAMLAACTAATQDHPAELGGLELPACDDSEDIVIHRGYTASYNHTTLTPDWVAWELTAEESRGECNGTYSFSRDPQVSFPKASREDYSYSGWDKGHMAPRADMKWSEKALEESYYFTNICPQDHTMNSGAWRKIEELTRRVAREYGTVYVVCGPVHGSGQYGQAGSVSVPDAFFKALAVMTGNGYRTVGFLVENNKQTGTPRKYAVSVDSVEAVVGRDLFPLLPEEAEASFDWNEWNK